MNIEDFIPRKVWYGLAGTSYKSIAQEIESENPATRKWISIYAIQKFDFSDDLHPYYDFIKDSKDFRYCAVIFTIPITIIECNDGIDDRQIDLIDLRQFNSEQEIIEYIKQTKIDPSLFTPPWRCAYPL